MLDNLKIEEATKEELVEVIQTYATMFTNLLNENKAQNKVILGANQIIEKQTGIIEELNRIIAQKDKIIKEYDDLVNSLRRQAYGREIKFE